MDKQTQFDEMVKELKEAQPFFYGSLAEHLIEKGYRKIPENAVVLTREEYEKLKSLAKGHCEYCYLMDLPDFESERLVRDTTRKETAEKFAERLKEKLCEFLEDNEDNDGKISKGIFLIDVIGVIAKDGKIISLGLIDEICKEFTEGKNGN